MKNLFHKIKNSGVEFMSVVEAHIVAKESGNLKRIAPLNIIGGVLIGTLGLEEFKWAMGKSIWYLPDEPVLSVKAAQIEELLAELK